MRTLQIRELPQPLYDLLSFKAQQHHRSLTPQQPVQLGDQLERWQREDRDR
jgi:plasmid stability protein